jgi:hypothetical protein
MKKLDRLGWAEGIDVSAFGVHPGVPRARLDCLTREFGDEILVYDRERNVGALPEFNRGGRMETLRRRKKHFGSGKTFDAAALRTG